MKYDEFKERCREAWSEKFNYLYIDLTKKMKVNFVFSMRVKTHIILNAFPRMKLFSFLKGDSNQNRDNLEKLEELASLQKQV